LSLFKNLKNKLSICYKTQIARSYIFFNISTFAFRRENFLSKCRKFARICVRRVRLKALDERSATVV